MGRLMAIRLRVLVTGSRGVISSATAHPRTARIAILALRIAHPGVRPSLRVHRRTRGVPGGLLGIALPIRVLLRRRRGLISGRRGVGRLRAGGCLRIRRAINRRRAGIAAEVGDARLDNRWLDDRAGSELIHLDFGRAHDAFAVDVREHDVAVTTELDIGIRHRNVSFANDAAGDHRGYDALLLGIDEDILHSSSFRAIGGADHVLVLTDAKD